MSRFAGYPLVGALLIGSLLASHTLIAYPIVEKLGQLRNEAVTVTIGATVFTDDSKDQFVGTDKSDRWDWTPGPLPKRNGK